MFEENYPGRIRVSFYPYTYVRLMAMRGKLYRKQDYDKLLKMQAAEIAKYLEESDYKEDILSLGKELEGYPLVESAIYANFVRRIRKLQDISSPEMNYLVRAYLKRYDIYNLKTILRAKAAGQQAALVSRLLLPLGLLTEEKLLALLDCEDLSAILQRVGFSSKDFGYALEYHKKEGSLLELENFLDKSYYTFLFSFIQHLSGSHNLFKGFLQLQIDVLNLQLLLRMKRIGIDEDRLRPLFFAGGNIFTPSRLHHLAKMDIVGIVDALKHTQLKKLLLAHEAELIAHDFTRFEAALDVWLLQQSTLLLHQNPLSVDTMLGYMFAKEIEVKNLQTLIKGKQLHLDENFLAAQLVIDR